MTDTGKAARRRHGTRFAAKQAKPRRTREGKTFGKLPISTVGKTAAEFVRKNSGFDLIEAPGYGGPTKKQNA